MKAAICEDEKNFADRLSAIVKEILKEHSPQIDRFPDGAPLLKKISARHKYDLIFLDLNLENSDGMDTAIEIRKYDRTVPIIFVTGIEGRAAEGYSAAAFDYIFKPDADKKLPQVLKRYCREYFMQPLTVTDADNRTHVVAPSEVLYAESDGRGTLWHTKTEKIRSAVSINKTAAMLPEDKFIQIYKSIYVNISEIKRIDSDTAELSDGSVLPLSRRRRRDTLSAVMKSMRNI